MKKIDGGSMITKVSPAEGKELLAHDQEIILVDVRRDEEFEEGHIPNANHIVLDTLAEVAPAKLPKDAKVMVYCKAGGRSKKAAETLDALGYQHVYDLGGIQDWPYEVVK